MVLLWLYYSRNQTPLSLGQSPTWTWCQPWWQKMTAKIADEIKVSHKLCAIHECQYCQLCFRCPIRKELDQWSLQPLNVTLLYPLIFNFAFTNIICFKLRIKLQIYRNIKLAVLSILCVCENPEYGHQRSHKTKVEFFNFVYKPTTGFFHFLIFAGSHQPPHNTSSRSFLSCYWIFTITIVATFSGNFMAYMTVTKLKLPINNVHELAAKSGYQAAIPGGGATQQFFQVHHMHISWLQCCKNYFAEIRLLTQYVTHI